MYANYHTHTVRCNHAAGTEREYVEQGIAGGLRVLGFADHTPQYFPGEYYSGFRMRPQQLDGYIDTVLALREEYKHRIDIHLGLEVEYYPALFPQLLAVLRQKPIEYIILGQHMLGNEEGEHYSGAPTGDPVQLRRYVDQTIEGMRTGLFTYFAHPDLLHYTGDDATYIAEARRLCLAAKELDMPLEINLLGIAEERNYPDERFWRIAGEVGNTVVLGVDAHRPEALNDPAAETAARALAQRCGIRLTENIPLRPLR